MKRKGLLLTCLSSLLVILLASPAFAVYDSDDIKTITASADALHMLGLFNGVGVHADGTPDYALERVPTRCESIAMLVRLLGKEEAAIKGVWVTPFNDVPDWARQYVGYAYANGLAMGTGRNTFGGNDPVSASQYLTFVLRALGYSSGTDFQWDRAWELSDRIGLTDGTYNGAGGSFLRGDAAFISFCALLTKLKESDLYLADKLIGEGVFTPAEFETCCIMLSEAIGQEQPEAAPKEPPDIRIETVHYEWDWLAWTWSYDLAIPLDAVEYYKELERDPYSILTGYSSYVSDPLDDEYLKALAQLFLDKSRDDGYGDDDAVQLAISFVQSLAYLPDDDSLDYDYPKYPLETLYDKGGDCEDTSILLVSLIREMGYGCCLIEFEDHMGVGVLGTDNVKGRYFERNGNKYFYVETTGEGWEIGEMPDEYVYETAHIWPF